jgi:hypothetical protein
MILGIRIGQKTDFITYVHDDTDSKYNKVPNCHTDSHDFYFEEPNNNALVVLLTSKSMS